MMHNLWDFTLNDVNVFVVVDGGVAILSSLWHPLTPHNGGVKGSNKKHWQQEATRT